MQETVAMMVKLLDSVAASTEAERRCDGDQ